MKKIEAVGFFDRHGEFFERADNILQSDTPIYTSDALIAVAEYVRDAIHEYNGVDVSQVDLRAIINQLTGE